MQVSPKYYSCLPGFSVKFDQKQVDNLKPNLLAKSENKVSQVSESMKSGWLNLEHLAQPLSKSARKYNVLLLEDSDSDPDLVMNQPNV